MVSRSKELTHILFLKLICQFKKELSQTAGKLPEKGKICQRIFLAKIPVLPVPQLAPMALVLGPMLRRPAAASVRPIQGWGKPGGGLMQLPGGWGVRGFH